MTQSIFFALVGGVLIGVAATLMLLYLGKVTGISGITYRTLLFLPGDTFWRVCFLSGLLCGGWILHQTLPQLISESFASRASLITAGLLVGFGTVLGNGCTSGHGVCGISRLSKRSIYATLTFMGCAVLTTLILKHV